LPATVPSTAPISDPKAERQPDIARSIAVELGSRIEIPFDGTGWTYLGERDGKEGILYESRRYQDSGLVFVLGTARQGDFILRFQRQDLLRGTTNEELVAVKVGPKAAVIPSGTAATLASGGAAAAGGTSTSTGAAATVATGGTSSRGGQTPSGPSASTQPATSATQPAASASAGSRAPAGSATAVSPTTGTGTPSAGTTAGTGQSATASSAPATTATAATGTASGIVPAGAASPAPATSIQGLSPASFLASLPDSPEGIVRAARAELSSGRVANCLAALDRFMELHPEGMDEVYYLYGVALEQNGATKDIKRAYSFYKKLHDDFPQSQLWDMAADRMSYIERHYFSVR
jgi:hypothetical protein